MGDGSLSQDEIDALLKGTDDVMPSAAPEPSPSFGGGGDLLSMQQKSGFSDMMNSVMAAIAPTLGGYLQKDLSITGAVVDARDSNQFSAELAGEFVQVQMGFNGGVTGQNLVVLSKKDAGVIASLMMGQEGVTPAEITETHKSTLQEFISTLLSSAATQIGMKTGMQIGTSPPDISVVGSGSELSIPRPNAVRVTYNINVGGVLNSQFYHFADIAMVQSMLSSGAPQQGQQQYGGGGGMQMQPQSQPVDISPVKFPPLSGPGIPENTQNIGLLMDVQLTLTVELGRTKQLVKDVLGLGEGSIIELDKLAGEPVDLLVNNKLIAKGEVVVIDENFGVRVTDIVSPSERLTKIGNS